MKSDDVPNLNNMLSLYRGHCGHRWVGATEGLRRCPVCDDRSVASEEPIAVQSYDWGSAWKHLEWLNEEALQSVRPDGRSRGGAAAPAASPSPPCSISTAASRTRSAVTSTRSGGRGFRRTSCLISAAIWPAQNPPPAPLPRPLMRIDVKTSCTFGQSYECLSGPCSSPFPRSCRNWRLGESRAVQKTRQRIPSSS